MGFISHYKQKPEHVRRRFAATVSILSTVLIAFVYISVSTSLFRGNESEGESGVARRYTSSHEQTATPVHSLKSGAESVWEMFEEIIQEGTQDVRVLFE